MRRIEAVIFDLGNTLIHFEGEWTDVLAEGDKVLFDRLAEAGLALDEEAFLTRYRDEMEAYYRERETEFIEYTSLHVLRQLLGQWGYQDIPEEVLQPALNAFYAVTQAHWTLEEDAIQTLETLRRQQYRLGLVSNAGDNQDVQTLVDNAGIREYFDIIVTSAAEGIRKPNPKIFAKLLEYWNLPPESAVMVGDTLGADILGAQNAGIYAIWIRRRANSPANRGHEGVIHPDASVDGLGELPGLLERLNGSGQSEAHGR